MPEELAAPAEAKAKQTGARQTCHDAVLELESFILLGARTSSSALSAKREMILP